MIKKNAEHAKTYERRRDEYVAFSASIKNLLESLISAGGVNFHVVETRTKTVESFKEKISRPGKKYNDPLLEIQDLCGARVICYFNDDVDSVVNIINDEFDVVSVESGHDPSNLQFDQFGYISKHLILKVHEKRKQLTEWIAFSDFCFEIQIRTVVQHAWSAVSHIVKYKQEADIPSALQRRLHRIAGLFELADDEFKEIRNQRADLRANAQKSIARGDKEIALTVESLSAFIERWPGAAALVASASAAGFDFNEDIEEEGSYVSDPYILARKIGIDTVDKFEEALSTDISDYLKKLFVADGKATSWIATLPFLIILVLVNHKPSNITIEDLVSIGFSKDIAEYVVRIAQE